MQSLVAGQALVAKPFTASHAQTVRRQPVRLVVRAQQQGESKDLLAAIRNVDVLKPTAAAVVANVLMALPAHAESGKLFDFGLTLPVMVGEFLLLMVFLDKTWFGPVGKVLDDRDKMIRDKLAAFRGGNEQVIKLQEEAEALIAAARADAQKAVLAAKTEAQAQAAEKIAAMKEKVDRELNTALAALDKEKAEAMANLDAQVDKLSADILTRILPEGVKI